MTPKQLAALIGGADRPDAKPSDTKAIERFEKELRKFDPGATLPDDYRRFLAMTPGGEIDGVVTFPIGSDRDYLARVYGLDAARGCAIVEQMQDDHDEAMLPRGLLRIMEGRGGDAIALAVGADRIGEVFFIDHEVAEEDGPPTLEDAESDDWGYAILLAPNFSAFVEGLAAGEA